MIHDVLELALDLVSTFSANESKGHDISTTVIYCQQSFNAQVPIIHAILEQPLLEHTPVLPLPCLMMIALLLDAIKKSCALKR